MQIVKIRLTLLAIFIAVATLFTVSAEASSIYKCSANVYQDKPCDPGVKPQEIKGNYSEFKDTGLRPGEIQQLHELNRYFRIKQAYDQYNKARYRHFIKITIRK